MSSKYLVTGALGCIGSWVTLQLIEAGHKVVAADLGSERSRLRLVSGSTLIEDEIAFANADVTDKDALGGLVSQHDVERIIHLAAIQVPASHANPPAGASVNVVGTANILEVARTRELESVVFASSVAVYGPELASSREAIPSDADQNPSTFYGVFKRADEAVARLYHDHYGVRSIGLRPHTVYGPGRDTGLTSAPTWAMLAKAGDEDYQITFSGNVGLQYAPDVAQTFIRASNVVGTGRSYSVRGAVTAMSDLATLLNQRTGDGTITVTGSALPFPAELDDSDLAELIGAVPETPLEDGINATISSFKSADPEHLAKSLNGQS